MLCRALLFLLTFQVAAQTRVLLQTELGEIEIAVDTARAPATAANFLRYVQGGFYNGGRFHRTVKPDNQPNNKVKIEVIQAEVSPDRKKDQFSPVALERTKITGLSHVDGAVSMARDAPDSATSDFFICIGDQPELDFGGKRNPDGQGFAAFGRVVRGMEVVKKIQQAPAVEQKLTPAVKILRAEAASLALLRRNLERITQGVRADWGVYIKSLDTGEEIAINAGAVMDTMSVIKIPLLVEAFRQLDAGRWKLNDRVELKKTGQRPGTGVLRTLDPGLSLTWKDVLTLMIIQSDNTATDMAFAQVGGPQRVTEAMRELGLNTITATGTAYDWFQALGASDRDRFHFEGKNPFGLASPRDIGILLEKIARNEAASPASCAEMLRILRAQQMNTRIPKYLAGAATPHKTGDFGPFIANDVGLIETSRARVVVVFFTAHHRGIYAQLEDAIARASEQVWEYFNYR